jgi:hypothetical protein
MRLLVDGAQGRRRTGNPHCVGQPAKRDEGELRPRTHVRTSQHVARVLAVPAVLVIFYPDAIRRTEISDGVKVLGHLGRLGQSREEAAHCEPDDTRMGGRSRIALLNVTKQTTTTRTLSVDDPTASMRPSTSTPATVTRTGSVNPHRLADQPHCSLLQVVFPLGGS